MNNWLNVRSLENFSLFSNENVSTANNFTFSFFHVHSFVTDAYAKQFLKMKRKGCFAG